MVVSLSRRLMPAAVFVCLLAVMSLVALVNPRGAGADEPAITKTYEIAVDGAAHANYGLGYPVTYKFGIPAGLSSGCTVYKSVDDGGTWTPLPTKTSADFFNGIECARFDYANHFVYISVSLPGDRDYLHVCLVHSGSSQTMTFSSIPQYYDDRQCAAMQTHDEMRQSENDTLWLACKAMMDACQSRQLWTTIGIITGSTWSQEWGWIQSQLDEGFVEAASHSRTHSHATFSDSECAGSRDDIISKLAFPAIYRKGTDQYVPGWLSPYNEMDDASRQNLGEALYLGVRAAPGTVGSWPAWSDAYGTYSVMQYCLREYGYGYESCTLEQLNTEFDTRHDAGQIFFITGHPENEVALDAKSFATGKMAQHYDYISGRTDVWYVGFGAAFMYHYCAERGTVTVTPVENGPPTILSVHPSEAYLGYTSSVAISGTNLTGASSASFGSGITVSDFTVNSSIQITATITIADDAAIGLRNVSVTTPRGSAVLKNSFTVSEKANQAPNTPVNSSPNNGATDVSLMPTLRSSDFSDPDAGDSHAASQWQITTTPGDYSSPIFNENTYYPDLTSVGVPTLNPSTTYYWRVKYCDNYDAWSGWSEQTSFKTVTRPPNRPGNTSPADGAVEISLAPTLRSSAFSDPDTGDTHAASQWQVTSISGNYSIPVLDSSTDNTNLVELTLSSGILNGNTTYFWHIRYLDNHGHWSEWSLETSFTTMNRPPNQPVNGSPPSEAVGVSLTPTLESSAFSDPDSGDTHGGSQWQVAAVSGDYSNPVFDGGTGTGITLSSGILNRNTTYYWHVRYKDNHGDWSDWSAETSFATESGQPPDQPANSAPADGAGDVSRTCALESSPFSDPDSGDVHTASQWQASFTAGDYSTSVFDSGTDAGHLTGVNIPSGLLQYSSVYYWHVRYQDSHSTWSAWSAETSFTTVARSQPLADFSVTSVRVSEGAILVSFSDLSSGATSPLTYAWDFDNDGTVDATEREPWHRYGISGTYTVSLAITDAWGETDTEVKPNYLTVIPPEGATVESADGRISTEFPSGAVDGTSLVTITTTDASLLPQVPKGVNKGDTCFVIMALDEDGKEIVTLSRPSTITVRYSEADVAAAGGAPGRLVLAYWDDAAGEWKVLNTSVDTANTTLSAPTSHLSTWAVLAKTTSASNGLPLWIWVVIGLAAVLVLGTGTYAAAKRVARH